MQIAKTLSLERIFIYLLNARWRKKLTNKRQKITVVECFTVNSGRRAPLCWAGRLGEIVCTAGYLLKNY